MKITATIVAVSALTLAGCTDTTNGSNAQTGAIVGGTLGAIIGAQSDDDRLAKTVVGGVIGAAIGGAIGTSLDRQAAELRRDIGDGRVKIVNTGRELIVTLPQDILFATDSAAVRPDLQDDLWALADNLQDYPKSRVEIVGHTDNVGAAAYNQDLSQRRAASVAAVLRNAGVSGGRLTAFGRGESQPIASNLTAAGRAQNRRVDIIIRPTS